MKYALVDGNRHEAQPDLKGTCPGCGSAVVPKCGEIKINHWAHKGTRICDHWWENETEWHRSWKDKFPVDWQECVHHASDGERHIADVKTSDNWVLEFQHSFLNPEERRIRSKFYGKIAWVVNGQRRKRDKTNFFKSLENVNPIFNKPPVWKVLIDDCEIIREWNDCGVPVFFDFGNESPLGLLIPNSHSSWAFITPFAQLDFINHHLLKQDSEASNFTKLMEAYKQFAANYISQLEHSEKQSPLNGFRQFQARQQRSRRF